MRFIKLLVMLLFILGLVSCGKYHGAYGSKYYTQDDREIHPIVVPHHIPSPVGEQYFTVPNTNVGQVPPKLSLLPPDPTFRARLAEYHKKHH